MKKIITFFLGGMLVLLFTGVLGTGSVSAKNDTIRLKVFVHEPNHGKPIPATTCTTTINDRVDAWLPAGWNMPTTGMTYKINLSSRPTNLSQNQVSNAVTAAFATWTAADRDQIFTDGGTTSVKTAKLDGVNAILWKGISGSALAITYVWYYTDTGQLAESDTIFNKNYKWSLTSYDGNVIHDCAGVPGTYDIQNIGTHEFGHWVGLDDLYNAVDKDLTMYGYGDTQELKADTLGLGDINGAKSIAP